MGWGKGSGVCEHGVWRRVGPRARGQASCAPGGRRRAAHRRRAGCGRHLLLMMLLLLLLLLLLLTHAALSQVVIRFLPLHSRVLHCYTDQ